MDKKHKHWSAESSRIYWMTEWGRTIAICQCTCGKRIVCSNFKEYKGKAFDVVATPQATKEEKFKWLK